MTDKAASRLTPHVSRSFSFEFYPPKGPKGEQALADARKELAALGPDFFSVTFGAGGTTRSGTLATVVDTMRDTGIATAPHLSCIEGTRESIKEMVDSYADAGVDRIVALRGDIPEGGEELGVFSYASELVAFLRQEYGSRFHLEVGCYPEVHPETPDPDADLDNFVRKVDAGADSAMTQYFYNADAYFDFVDRATARGVNIPIVPGIMPFASWGQVNRFSALCGADIPRWVAARMAAYDAAGDQQSVREFGIDLVSRLCQRLLENDVPGLHFYALNRADPTATIWRNLGLSQSS